MDDILSDQKKFSKVSLKYDTLLNFATRVSNRRGGQNKKGSWQISAKIINRQGAINREVGKNLQS